MRLVEIPQNPLPPGAMVQAVAVGPIKLRVARWAASGPGRGTVAVLPGRAEFVEKYAEVVGELLGRGFGVVVVDWRGQGGSSRLLDNPRKGHVRRFADYRADLDAVVREVLAPHCPRPWTALAHSMGGAIVVDHAARGGGTFDRLVLSAPMIDIFGLRMVGLVRLLAATVTLAGFGGRYVPGGSDRAWMARPFAGNGLTLDERRFSLFNALAAAAPELVLAAPTFGWLHAAFRAMHFIRRPATIRRVTVPTLVVACGADRVVDTPATERFAALLPLGHGIVVRGAMHEILMERDAIRAEFWAAFDRFMAPLDGHPGAAYRSAEQTVAGQVSDQTGP